MKDNKLIAEFMGVHDEISLDSIAGNIHSWCDAPFFYITEDSKEKVMEGIAEYSKYHTSWDWLMPVVDKIEIEGFDPHGIIDNALGSREIEDVHDACVTLIKAHNSERNRWKEQTRIEEGLDHKG